MFMALERALLQFFGIKKLKWMMASNEAFIKPGQMAFVASGSLE